VRCLGKANIILGEYSSEKYYPKERWTFIVIFRCGD
jgi:hypothetical protein